MGDPLRIDVLGQRGEIGEGVLLTIRVEESEATGFEYELWPDGKNAVHWLK